MLVVPLALAVALPWALALLPYGLWLGGAAVVVRWREQLLAWLIAAWEAIDQPRVANWLVGGGIALYAAVMLPHILAVPWINHADYADNAVVARNLVQGQGFSVDYVAQFYRDWPTLRHPAETWPPLQPLLIAAAFFVFGVSVGVAKLPNLIVMLGMLWLIYRIGRWLWSPRVGMVAALLVALHPAMFEGVVYPLNDMVFTLLALGAIALFVYVTGSNDEGEEGHGRRLAGLRKGAGWALLGIVGGLLLLAKPSGAILLVGGGAWALWRGWRDGRLRPVLVGGVLAALFALSLYLPWLMRNQATFGQPFYTTESYDAFLLEYRPWENIYQVYAGKQPLPHRSLLVRYGLDAVGDKIGAQFREAWGDLIKGAIFPLLLLPLGVVAALVARERRQRGALAALGLAVAGYAVFIAVYWHYERRYALFLVPWGALFGAAGLWWLHDRVAEARGRALAGIAALVVVGAMLVPQVQAVRDDWSASLRTPGSVVVADWLRDNTPGNAVVMTRNPWELSFHGERLSVMIPFNDLPTILAIGKKYGATYLQLDHLTEDDLRRPALGPLYDGPDEWQGFRKVFDRRNDDGEGLLVYEFPK
ncbi:MAG: glycosyltransferase family 39 protein [Thermomicrobiales bacterium]